MNNGLTWTNTHFALDTGAGSALNPRAAACMQSKPGALVVWSDFRSGTGVNGDIYSAVTQ